MGSLGSKSLPIHHQDFSREEIQRITKFSSDCFTGKEACAYFKEAAVALLEHTIIEAQPHYGPCIWLPIKDFIDGNYTEFHEFLVPNLFDLLSVKGLSWTYLVNWHLKQLVLFLKQKSLSSPAHHSQSSHDPEKVTKQINEANAGLAAVQQDIAAIRQEIEKMSK
ncbi:MAG: hypothetical protein IPK84_04555 [Candidatus Moraniibacteriota bacterium]|nr:MAG: hypothetical protein IPK84_04555 [Candidatus Moranbacteria bacterium]